MPAPGMQHLHPPPSPVSPHGSACRPLAFPPSPLQGLLGLTGSNDLRAVIEAADRGDPRARLGLAMFVYRVRKYIGSYMAVLDGQVRRTCGLRHMLSK